MKPTKAGVMPSARAAPCTEATNTSLTSATSTVTPASVTSATPIGNGGSSPSACALLPKKSLCVFNEKTSPSV
jgi:hypothetical protein